MDDADYITIDITITLAGTGRRTVSVEVVRDAWAAATDAQRADMVLQQVMDFVSWDYAEADEQAA